MWLTILVVFAAATLGVSSASPEGGGTVSADVTAALSGPTEAILGEVDTYTLTVTNNGPDPTDSDLSIGVMWPDGDGAAQFVGAAGPGTCAYSSQSNADDQLACAGPPAPMGVGETYVVDFSIRWTQSIGVTMNGGVGTAPEDPDNSNNSASLFVVVTPSGGGSSGGGGGGGSGGGGTPTPTAPPYSFAEHLPPGTQYVQYARETLPGCPETGCPVEVRVTAGAIPPGVTLTGNGILVGKPFRAGTFSFTLTATPAQGWNYTTISEDYTIVVAPFRTPAGSGANAHPHLVLPRRSLTPGATNPAVRQSTIRRTICAAGWTAKIQPPVSFTDALKIKQMRQYGETGSPRAYEEDHLIPVELGGAPRSAKNLWPEPRAQSKHSDPLERALKRRLCAGKVTVAAARKQILAYKRARG